jgi:hypothetical protein
MDEVDERRADAAFVFADAWARTGPVPAAAADDPRVPLGAGAVVSVARHVVDINARDAIDLLHAAPRTDMIVMARQPHPEGHARPPPAVTAEERRAQRRTSRLRRREAAAALERRTAAGRATAMAVGTREWMFIDDDGAGDTDSESDGGGRDSRRRGDRPLRNASGDSAAQRSTSASCADDNDDAATRRNTYDLYPYHHSAMNPYAFDDSDVPPLQRPPHVGRTVAIVAASPPTASPTAAPASTPSRSPGASEGAARARRPFGDSAALSATAVPVPLRAPVATDRGNSVYDPTVSRAALFHESADLAAPDRVASALARVRSASRGEGTIADYAEPADAGAGPVAPPPLSANQVRFLQSCAHARERAMRVLPLLPAAQREMVKCAIVEDLCATLTTSAATVVKFVSRGPLRTPLSAVHPDA